jgi:hypothetical protein
MKAIKLNRLDPYLEATRDEQPSGGISVTCAELGRGKFARASLSGNTDVSHPLEMFPEYFRGHTRDF